MRQNMVKDKSLAENNTKLNNVKSIGSRNFNKNAHGITLIALVITIIVLLILAGVSISAITGNDSAMEKAQTAKNESEKGDELDFIKLAVVDAVAHGTTGYVTGPTLADALTGSVLDATQDATQLTKISNNANGPWIITGNTGMKYKVKPNGEVTSAEAVATVEFTQTEATIGISRSKKLAITAKGTSGSETEANEVKFTSSNTNVAKVQEDGSIYIQYYASEGATATITVEADGISGSNQCVVTAIRFPNIEEYIEYSVEYTDMYSSTTYSSTTGWKILDPGTYNDSTKKYDGVKIISSGIPACLKYQYNNPNDNTWWGTQQTGSAKKAAFGLENNFTSIPLNGSSSNLNTGWYTSVVNNDQATEYDADTGAVFLTNKASGVHNLTLNELNTALNIIDGKKYGDYGYRDPESDLTTIVNHWGLFSSKSGGTFSYWLACAYDNNCLCVVDWNSGMITGGQGYGDYGRGLRPVITLKSVSLKKNGSYWQVDPVQN